MNKNLARVNATIGAAVVGFYRHRLSIEKPEFHADDLRTYITSHAGITAPGSADRILRLKRRKGEVNYKIVSRRNSLYRFEERNEASKAVVNTGYDVAMGTR